MTVKASDAVATAKKEIGTRATNYRKCKYNTWYYGSAVSGDAYHWCAVFICWVFNQLGALISMLYLKTASCGYMAKAFLDKGRLIRPKSLTAGLSTKDVKVGDIVFFHWSTERSTLVPGTYVSDHVGIVTAVNSNGTIDTVEGNTIDTVNGQVAARTRSMNVVSCLGRPDYAPESGTAVAAPTAKATKPAVLYRVHSGGVWHKEVNDFSSYAGVAGKAITDVAIKVTSGSVKYRVHIKGGGWLPYVTGYNIADAVNGYAGNGKPIDAIEVYYMTPESVRQSFGYLKAKYRVHSGALWYSWQYDNEKTGGQDGYAGKLGQNIYRVQLTLSN
nr:CHAP domain-containing protein [uncultured Ruminococcus sp.]